MYRVAFGSSFTLQMSGQKNKIFQSREPSCKILLHLKRNYLFLHLIINLKVVATVTRHSLVFKGNEMRRERMARNHSSLPVSALWLSLFLLIITVRVQSEVCAPVTTPNSDVIGSRSTPMHHCTARWEDEMFNVLFLCLYCTSQASKNQKQVCCHQQEIYLGVNK